MHRIKRISARCYSTVTGDSQLGDSKPELPRSTPVAGQTACYPTIAPRSNYADAAPGLSGYTARRGALQRCPPDHDEPTGQGGLNAEAASEVSVPSGSRDVETEGELASGSPRPEPDACAGRNALASARAVRLPLALASSAAFGDPGAATAGNERAVPAQQCVQRDGQ